MPQEAEICFCCKGGGEVYRKVTKVVKMIEYVSEDGDYEAKEVSTIVGGVDACQRCARIAEAFYQTTAEGA